MRYVECLLGQVTGSSVLYKLFPEPMSFLTRLSGLGARCHSVGLGMPVTLRRNVNHTQSLRQLSRGSVYALFCGSGTTILRELNCYWLDMMK
jgi:hypothetical protein